MRISLCVIHTAGSGDNLWFSSVSLVLAWLPLQGAQSLELGDEEDTPLLERCQG